MSIPMSSGFSNVPTGGISSMPLGNFVPSSGNFDFSSVPLPDGGDTHFHLYPGGFDVTTRLPAKPYGVEDMSFHSKFNLQDFTARPDVLKYFDKL